MRQWVVLVLLASLAFTSGCDGASSDPPEERPETPMGAPQPAGTTYDATIEVAADQVVVRWSLENNGSHELLVADRIPVAAGAGVRWQQGSAYVIPHGRGVELSQRVFPWPDTDKTWATAPRVGVTRLAAGETLTGTLTLSKPLALNHPFGPDLGDGEISLPAEPDQVVFCLGVIAPPLKPALALAPLNGVETIVHGKVSFESQHVFCSDSVPFS
jgi:hypothetical protein